MNQAYNENVVLKKMAEGFADFFNRASAKLPYTKGLKGQVKSKGKDYYTITINGVDYKLKTDYELKNGNFVNLISMQNQGNDLVYIPTASDISSVEAHVDEDTETLYFE